MEQIQSGTTATVSSHPRTKTIAQCPFSPEASSFGTGREVLIDIRTAIEIGYDCFGVDRMLGLSSDVFALLAEAKEAKKYSRYSLDSPAAVLAATALHDFFGSRSGFEYGEDEWCRAEDGRGVILTIEGLFEEGMCLTEMRRATVRQRAPRRRRSVGRCHRKGSWNVDEAGQITLRCVGLVPNAAAIAAKARVRIHAAGCEPTKHAARVVGDLKHGCFTLAPAIADIETTTDHAVLIELNHDDWRVGASVQVWARLQPNGRAEFLTPFIPFRPRLRDFCTVFTLTAATVDAAEAIRSRLDLLNVNDCLHVPQRGFGALSAAQAWELFTQRKTSTRLRKTPAQQEAHS